MAIWDSRNRTFMTAWIAYASLYFLRKPFGVTKNLLSSTRNISSTQLGWMDAAFFLPYAVGQILLGNFWAKTNPCKLLGVAMMVGALSMLTFPYSSSWVLMAGMLFINGFAQSLCWPAVSRVTSSLYSGAAATTAFGVLNTSVFVGAFLATTFAVYIQDHKDFSLVYPCCSLVVIAISLLVFQTSKTVSSTSHHIPDDKTSDDESTTDSNTDKVGWGKILSIPMVVELCVIMLCLKLARYSIYMWLPMYFTVQLHYSDYWSGMLSTVFDMGGVVGSLSIGPVINRLFRGVSVWGCTVYTLLSALSFLAFTMSGNNAVCHVIFLFLAGAFNSGPDGIVAGSIPAEIGKLEGRDLSGAIYGLVNGFGSFGSVIEGPLMGWLSKTYGWELVIDAIILVSFIGGLICLRLSVKHKRETSIGQVQLQ